MKKAIYVLLLFFIQCINLKGQKIALSKENFLDTLIIESNICGYNFDSANTSNGVKQQLIIAFNSQNNLYEYIKNEKSTFIIYHSISDSANNKPVKTVSYKNKAIERKTIEHLIESFKQNKNEYRSLLNYLTKQNINKALKETKNKWKISPRYSTLNERKAFYENCISEKFITEYINTKFNNGSFFPNSDYVTTLSINFKSQDRNCIYLSNFHTTLGQPWINLCDFKPNPDQLKISGEVVNLEIYNLLNHILPHKFLMKESMNPNEFLKDYVTWVINKMNI